MFAGLRQGWVGRRLGWDKPFPMCLLPLNEMNGVLGHLCAHIGYTGPGEPPEDEMTLPIVFLSNLRNRGTKP